MCGPPPDALCSLYNYDPFTTHMCISASDYVSFNIIFFERAYIHNIHVCTLAWMGGEARGEKVVSRFYLMPFLHRIHNPHLIHLTIKKLFSLRFVSTWIFISCAFSSKWGVSRGYENVIFEVCGWKHWIYKNLQNNVYDFYISLNNF